MYRIKSFQSPTDEEVNKWIADNPGITIWSVTKQSMYDLYQNREPTVCNQWTEVTILYTVPTH
jgi:hypothetical protein